jgi:hypothetical protein
MFSTSTPYFCQQNAGFLAIAFHIYSTPSDTSTDFALFLTMMMQKLCQNEFRPTLWHISYDRLKDDKLVGSYGLGLVAV